MNQVLSGYFDDAHRGLHGQREESKAKGFTQQSHVQLPPLQPPPTDFLGDSKSGSGSARLRHSNSMGALDYGEAAARGLQAERYDQALLDNSKLQRKLRQTQDQLSVTSAKKDAFRAQALRLEKEFKKGRETSDALQKELLEAKKEAEMSAKEANDAIAMMTEMRKAHIQEVRLLQRGLAARGNDAQFRNRVNEVADLVDKLGRAVVQRDEAIRDKTKMQVFMNKANVDMRALAEERTRLKRLNGTLQARLGDATRKLRIAEAEPDPGPDEDIFDSDEEFEMELQACEKRQAILKDTAAGADILAENLEKDKHVLKTRLKQEQQNVSSLEASVEHWVGECSEKDREIQDLQDQIEKMLHQQAILEEQIDLKKREIAGEVDDSREALEKKIAELEAERDEAQQAADGMVKVSDRLTEELTKVHDQYDDANAKKAKLKAEVAAGLAEGEGEKKEEKPVDDPTGPQRVLMRQQEQKAHTGELLHLEVHSILDQFEYRAVEVSSGEESNLKLSKELLKELDAEDPWTDLFGRTGFSAGPPRRLVISSVVGRAEVKLGESEDAVILTVYRYDAYRFFISAMNLATTQFVQLVLMEDQFPEALRGHFDSSKGNDEVFELLASRLSLEDVSGEPKLKFNNA